LEPPTAARLGSRLDDFSYTAVRALPLTTVYLSMLMFPAASTKSAKRGS
jgi:hypothetical protein